MFAILRETMLDLGAEPQLPGVRFPAAKYTKGWSCGLDAGPYGGDGECIKDANGYPNDIGDAGKPIPTTSCPTLGYCYSTAA
mmetsp:Transcript_19183/g.44236  ORF Transcript_19183/g.44236 Transcript_19183/m.44236 type:complete len:82 (+) Transcript_19183:1-246(+)